MICIATRKSMLNLPATPSSKRSPSWQFRTFASRQSSDFWCPPRRNFRLIRSTWNQKANSGTERHSKLVVAFCLLSPLLWPTFYLATRSTMLPSSKLFLKMRKQHTLWRWFARRRELTRVNFSQSFGLIKIWISRSVPYDFPQIGTLKSGTQARKTLPIRHSEVELQKTMRP